jgi:hypothetical protein
VPSTFQVRKKEAPENAISKKRAEIQTERQWLNPFSDFPFLTKK